MGLQNSSSGLPNVVSSDLYSPDLCDSLFSTALLHEEMHRNWFTSIKFILVTEEYLF